MCLDHDASNRLKQILLSLKESLKTQGFEQMTPNRQDDVGRRDEDFQPLNEMNQVLKSSKNKQTKQILEQIEHALTRFDDEPDLVGACEECEECIATRRLEILPYTRFCVKCQHAMEEQEVERSGRRNLTDYRS